MSRTRLYLALTAFIGATLLGSMFAGPGNGYLEATLGAKALNKADDQVVVQVTDLVSNAPILVDRFGIVHHPFAIDPNLANPWGTAESTGSPIWWRTTPAGCRRSTTLEAARRSALHRSW